MKGLNTRFLQGPRIFLINTALWTKPISSYPINPLVTSSGGPYYFDLQPISTICAGLTLTGQTPKKTGNPIAAYWLAQGKHIDIPKQNPSADFVFTPEFTGCKIYVDDLNNTTFRVYHIQVSHESTEYTNKNHGNGQIAALKFSDYGVDNDVARTRATAFLYYTNNQWHIYCQKLGGSKFPCNPFMLAICVPLLADLSLTAHHR
jgi:hypothetical protein